MLFFLNKNLFKWNQAENQERVFTEELPVYTWPGGDMYELPAFGRGDLSQRRPCLLPETIQEEAGSQFP